MKLYHFRFCYWEAWYHVNFEHTPFDYGFWLARLNLIKRGEI